ncbi:Hypothetical predicted protein [Olea europaea subsp. europaea]|uniref:Uncharacterized protein n=1 Tax=Olea europaea subsp. europaea TaxID=158383 RepID=A0A8S0T3V4_OLEEU|nr:Hypothetical predicted protein [Olea europaea subsp. europaea]
MQVKMTVETQEFSTMAWFQGAITDIDSHRDSHGTGFTFPWHMLQKPKAQQNSGILLDEEEESFDRNESSNSSAGHLNSSSSDQSHSSASLQGAKLDQNAISHKVLTNPIENVMKLESSTISTLANNGDSSSESVDVVGRVCTLGLCVFAVGFKCWGFGI